MSPAIVFLLSLVLCAEPAKLKLKNEVLLKDNTGPKTTKLVKRLDMLYEELKRKLSECTRDAESKSEGLIIPSMMEWSNSFKRVKKDHCHEPATEKFYQRIPLYPLAEFSLNTKDIDTPQIKTSEKFGNCPSYLSINEDPTRAPRKIMEVMCSCTRPCGKHSSYRCTALTSHFKVTRGGQTQYEKVHIGCACLDKGVKQIPNLKPIILQ